MRLTFQIRFHTHYGESLFLAGNHEIFGEDKVEKAIPLEYLNDQSWRLTVIIPKAAAPDMPISYSYILRKTDGTFIQDWGRDRTINIAALKGDEVLVIDSWNEPGAYENAFYTEPFREVLLKANHTEVRVLPPGTVTHVFKVKAPLLAKGQTLCLLGDTVGLRKWNINQPILFNRSSGDDFLRAEL